MFTRALVEEICCSERVSSANIYEATAEKNHVEKNEREYEEKRARERVRENKEKNMKRGKTNRRRKTRIL